MDEWKLQFEDYNIWTSTLVDAQTATQTIRKLVTPVHYILNNVGVLMC